MKLISGNKLFDGRSGLNYDAGEDAKGWSRTLVWSVSLALRPELSR
jgi:hypothetical protein